jgi:hypothetical protein
MGKKNTLIALCCSLFAVIAGCSQDTPVASIAQGSKYVALGSSFAAGPGIAAQLGTCGRSDHSYSQLVAAELDLPISSTLLKMMLPHRSTPLPLTRRW